MRIGQRMYLALLPAVLGLFTVVALAYWGRYAHSVPEWLVAAAIIAALASFGVAWASVRNVARRVERLASFATPAVGAPAVDIPPDELEVIENRVNRLSTAVDAAEAGRRAGQEALVGQQHAYGELLAQATHEAMRRLDEIRLPLHILLENHFGDLNENQEEMLGTARAAAEQAGDAFQRLGEIADLDRGALTLRRERLRPGDVVTSVVHGLASAAQSRNVRVTADVAPALQAIPGDRGRLQLALELLLGECLRRTADGQELHVTADVVGQELVVTATHGDGAADPIAVALGERLVTAHGGRVVDRGARLEVGLPRA